MPINEGQEEALMNNQRVPEGVHGNREISKASSEDSGVEMSNGAMVSRREGGRARCERKRNGKIIRENGTTVEGVTWADADETCTIASQDFQLQKEQEEKHSILPKQHKMLLKQYSERLLPKSQDLVTSSKVY